MKLEEAQRMRRIAKALKDSGSSVLSLLGEDIDEIIKPYMGDPWFPLDLTQEEFDHIKKGELISAIKKYRNRTDLGLKESKDFIEAAVKTLKENGVIPA